MSYSRVSSRNVHGHLYARNGLKFIDLLRLACAWHCTLDILRTRFRGPLWGNQHGSTQWYPDFHIKIAGQWMSPHVWKIKAFWSIPIFPSSRIMQWSTLDCWYKDGAPQVAKLACNLLSLGFSCDYVSQRGLQANKQTWGSCINMALLRPTGLKEFMQTSQSKGNLAIKQILFDQQTGFLQIIYHLP